MNQKFNIVDDIIELEETDLRCRDEAYKLCHKYFEPYCYFPLEGRKTRDCYEQILKMTGSVIFDHKIKIVDRARKQLPSTRQK